MKTRIIKIFLTVFFFCSINSFSQSVSNVGSSGANFLKIPVEPIGAALGNSNVATAEGASGLYWNPASIAYSNGTEIILSQVNWIADTKLSFIGFQHNLGFGSLGLSFTIFSMDPMEITTETTPNGTGQYFNSGSYAAALTYGMKVIDRFSFGGSVKYIYEYIWETHGRTILFDLGSVYQTDFYNMKIGMRLANFGGNVTFKGNPIDNKSNEIAQSGISYSYDPRLDRISPEYPLPQLFNVGISFEPFKLDNQKVVFTAAVNDPNDNKTQILFGSEYSWNDLLFLRVGYKSGYDEQNISAGLGLKTTIDFVKPQLDFAYVNFEKLGSVFFLSLRFGI